MKLLSLGLALSLAACNTAPTPEAVCAALGPLTRATHERELAKIPEGPAREAQRAQYESLFRDTSKECPDAMRRRREQTGDAAWRTYATCVLEASKTPERPSKCE